MQEQHIIVLQVPCCQPLWEGITGPLLLFGHQFPSTKMMSLRLQHAQMSD